jgi:hypothetical protein
MNNLARIKAIEKKNKARILEIAPYADDESGIYIFHREENGIKYAYVGQAKDLLARLADHLRGYQHIDNSIRSHGLWNEKNPTGYKITTWHYPEEKLDEAERGWIETYARKGYQLRNKTAGGQKDGKVIIAETKPPKGYRDGLAQGEKNTQRNISKMCNYLVVTPRDNTVRAQNAFKRFQNFIEIKGEEKQ